MQELRRQAYLKALGVTPWVARGRLPGAPESVLLERPATPAPEPLPERPEMPVPEAPREPVVARSNQPEPAPQPATPAESAVRFTLHAFAASGVLLVMQQADADAPEPGRAEQRMLAGLLRYFNVRDRRPRTFAWPLPGVSAPADHAHASLEAFLRRLCQDSGCDRVLWLLDEALTARLLRGERFRPLDRAGLPGLPVASLAEMIEQPEVFKRQSWQAMVRHGFQA